jgi:hypothetical protein
MIRYIDADKLIHHLEDEIKGCEPPFGGRANGKSIAYGTMLGLKSAISFANTLPTADVVEVRHGHWKYLWLDAVCSECGYINEAEIVTRCRSDPPYCPKCGAKMDGERSENGT